MIQRKTAIEQTVPFDGNDVRFANDLAAAGLNARQIGAVFNRRRIVPELRPWNATKIATLYFNYIPHNDELNSLKTRKELRRKPRKK